MGASVGGAIFRELERGRREPCLTEVWILLYSGAKQVRNACGGEQAPIAHAPADVSARVLAAIGESNHSQAREKPARSRGPRFGYRSQLAISVVVQSFVDQGLSPSKMIADQAGGVGGEAGVDGYGNLAVVSEVKVQIRIS